MVIYIKSFLLIVLLNIPLSATTYYVTTSGNDSNTGLSESTAWKTIKYAAGKVIAGDTVYVKTGTYTDKNINLSGGSVQKPILFLGYVNTPGDVTNIDWWDYETNRNLDPTKMPLLDGEDRSHNTAINLGSYIKLKNFQITNYENGIESWNDKHSVLENIIVTTIGDINDSYSGTGIGFFRGGGYHTVKNCIVLNAAAEGIMIYDVDYTTAENCKVYCDDAQNTYANTDYYFEVEASNCTIKNCYIERVGNLEHIGHGFCIKGDGYNWSDNLFENCIAKNLEGGGFVVRHRSVTNNTFENCTAYEATGFLVRDGASYNNYYNCKTVDCYSAVRFIDTDEDAGKQYAGRFNNFYNCLFTNSHYVINFQAYSLNSDANDNRFINCVFDGGNYLFNSQRTNYDNKMINCIVTNVTNYKSGGNIDFDFIYTNFWNNGFDTPTGTNLLSTNPLFVDLENNNYNLTSTSPLIDAGTVDTTDLGLPLTDANEYIRIFDGDGNGSAIIDIGAFEYQGASGGNFAPIANAGADSTIIDLDENGSETVMLNGSNSSDRDGSITSYTWKEGEIQIATGVNPTVNLNVGVHTITLIVSDNDGAIASDDVVITVKSADSSTSNYALVFNTGENKNENVVASGFNSFGENFTMEVWINLSSIPNSGNESHIISFWDGSQSIQTQLYINSSGNLSTQGSSGAAGFKGATVLNINQWYHIAYVRTATSVNLYLDGSFEAGTSTNSDAGVLEYLVLGRFRGCTDKNDFSVFNGKIDEVRIWRYACTQSDIEKRKDKELLGTESDLELYYNFNEGTGTILTDKTGNGHDGTLHNMDNSNWVDGVLLNPVKVENDSALPKKIFLSQNYPNPFNPSTVISFTLSKSEFTNLSVYNLVGEKVAELINETIEAGNHTVIFDASALSSGIYLYKISVGSYTSIKKMILLK